MTGDQKHPAHGRATEGDSGTKRATIAAMRAQGKTYREIGNALGISGARAEFLDKHPLKRTPDADPRPCATCGSPIPPANVRYCSPACWPPRYTPTGRSRGRPRKS